MAFTFPSDEWIMALSERLNQSADYERSARDWEGDFIFVVEADEDFDDPAYFFLGLFHGKSTGAAIVESEDERLSLIHI